MVPFYSKRPYEKFTIILDFVDNIPSGVNIISGICSAQIYRTEVDATADLLMNGTNAVISGTQAKIVIMNGLVGTLYDVVFDLSLSDGQKISGLARIFVDE